MRNSFILLAIVFLLISVVAVAQQGNGQANGNQDPNCTQSGDCSGDNQGDQNGQGNQGNQGNQNGHCAGDGQGSQGCQGDQNGSGARGGDSDRGPRRGKGQYGGGWGEGRCDEAVSEYREALTMQNFDADEERGLVFAREEEKLARDVYLTLYLDWGVPVFSKIARAEQKHMDSLEWMLDRYSIDDPVVDDTVGIFADHELQALFDDLVARGRESVEASLLVGATIEDLDIFDLEGMLEATDNADYSMVLYNLIKGSRNHLRSFAYELDMLDIEYQAEFLSPEAIAEILASPRERRVVYDENGEQLDICPSAQN